MRMNIIGLGLAVALTGGGCSAVYPELKTPVRAAPAGRQLEPKPPGDLLYIAFTGATIPARTRDGRDWDAIGGSAPDPFAKLIVNKKDLIVTPTEANTLTPTWPDQVRANYRIPKGSGVRVELWDSNPLNDAPICVKAIRNIHLKAENGGVDLRCDSGARISITIEPAHAVLGIGLYYELRTVDMFITRVIQSSAAARAGLGKGVEILKIQDQEVSKLDEGEARSLINANAPAGLKLTVKLTDGAVKDVVLKDDAMYPELGEGIDLP